MRENAGCVDEDKMNAGNSFFPNSGERLRQQLMQSEV